jgi:hypothetical protein
MLVVCDVQFSKDKLGLLKLHPTATNGREWYSAWTGARAQLVARQRDPLDTDFELRGDGTLTFLADGSVKLSGTQPRMYINDRLGERKWHNVEISFYIQRVSDTGDSSAGAIAGVRSDHQDTVQTQPETWCKGPTYYGRLLYDGRLNFQKEWRHEDSYVNSHPDTKRAVWNTSDGQMPRNTWIGYKLTAFNQGVGVVKLALYRDMTNGANGGSWVKLLEVSDPGVAAWQPPPPVCGFFEGQRFVNPATSVFVRNTGISDARYKWFSVREIKPAA